MRGVVVVAVGVVLGGCANMKTSRPVGVSDSGAPIPENVHVVDAGSDAGCKVAPAWSPPLVLSGEIASIVSTCGQNGSPPKLVGAAPPTDRIELDVGFLSHADELAMFASDVSDPASPLYRQYLTPAEVAARFGPSECNYQAVIDWLTAAGLSVSNPYPDHFLVDADGTVAQIEALLHVTINHYLRPDGTMFYAPDRDPSVTVGASIAIDGLDDCYVSKPVLSMLPPGMIDPGSRDAGRD